MAPGKRRRPAVRPTTSAAIQTSGKRNKVHILEDSDDEDMQEIIDTISIKSPSPVPSPASGQQLWKNHYYECKSTWNGNGELEGYAGMTGIISNFKLGEGDYSVGFGLKYEDIEGDQRELTVEVVFESIASYPAEYRVLIFSESPLTRRAQTTLSRFAQIYELDLSTLLSRLLSSLQGDDDADGGDSPDEDENLICIDDEPESLSIGRGFETAKGSPVDLGKDWAALKEHFSQARSMGYRPGFIKTSDFYIISFSIPLKNLPIDPNTLSIWDDGLVDAWKEDQRFTLLVGVQAYPPHPDSMRYWLGFEKNYKPSSSVIRDTVDTTHPGGLRPFYLSSSLLSFLKYFPRSYKIRSGYGINWASADRTAFDDEKTTKVFLLGEMPSGTNEGNKKEPINLGFEQNIPLCAFYWILRRFGEAAKYCLNCGLEVEIPSLRPYVCNKPLCLYGYMSLGLGPSIEHTISHHPGVVDLLLTFAHASAASKARMELPLKLHIELPTEFGVTSPTLIDDLTVARAQEALVWLIERLPKVSEIISALETGSKLYQLACPTGSIGVLRWVVGSCRAYLKESRPGEGLLLPPQGSVPANDSMRQFTFVVGSPEQESNFKTEIEKAQITNTNCVKYPSLLAFHGSGLPAWHNILRTGLDFLETKNGRVYGNGVYFASEYETSQSYTSRIEFTPRPNADFVVTSATALVEIVNVPDIFVSKHPYYVVGNVKQIKPFLLLVCGMGEPTSDPSASIEGEVFKSDPNLARHTVYKGSQVRVKMPEKLHPTIFVDDEPDDEVDHRIMDPPQPLETRRLFEPSPSTRFEKLQRMPAPTETSVMASRSLSKQFKALVKTQEEEDLPFYVDPDIDSLYCWTLELYKYPESILKTELLEKKIKSVIAELRFPASFPQSPPFMRILHPRFLPFSSGGGGNITGGGSICNEILTSTGWNPTFTIEALVRDIMTNMTEANPPARLDGRMWDQPYSLNEAMMAYKRVAQAHDWAVPKDFDKIAL